MPTSTSDLLEQVQITHKFDPDVLFRYASIHVSGFPANFTSFIVKQFGHRQSNLTFLLEARTGELVKWYVLRKKPPGTLLPSAHAVDREYQVLRALGAAILARRREYLYLSGLLSSSLSILLWLHFASSIFGGSVAIFKFELYFGLLVLVGNIVVDTQDIIEKAHLGVLGYVKHVLNLFTDFVAVFIRVLIIMNSAEKNEKKKKRRD